MKENEPKVKDSQKYWDENRLALSKGTSCTALREEHKATYDRLVSLEAKIEELKILIGSYQRPSVADDLPSWTTNIMCFRLERYESELAELVKELKI